MTYKRAEVLFLHNLPITVSIERTLLKYLFHMGMFNTMAPSASSVTDLSNDNINNYIQCFVSGPDKASFDPNIIEYALK